MPTTNRLLQVNVHDQKSFAIIGNLLKVKVLFKDIDVAAWWRAHENDEAGFFHDEAGGIFAGAVVSVDCGKCLDSVTIDTMAQELSKMSTEYCVISSGNALVWDRMGGGAEYMKKIMRKQKGKGFMLPLCSIRPTEQKRARSAMSADGHWVLGHALAPNASQEMNFYNPYAIGPKDDERRIIGGMYQDANGAAGGELKWNFYNGCVHQTTKSDCWVYLLIEVMRVLLLLTDKQATECRKGIKGVRRAFAAYMMLKYDAAEDKNSKRKRGV